MVWALSRTRDVEKRQDGETNSGRMVGAMKVLHVPFCYGPGPVGGTEVYVESLAREQIARGLEVVISAPGLLNEAYELRGIRVRRFAASSGGSELADIYGEGDMEAAANFEIILREERPDLLHLHAFTAAASNRLVGVAKAHGLPVVFTYHTPAVSCLRGGMMRWGSSPCDGRLRLHACAMCALHGRGLAKGAAVFLGALPRGVGRTIGRLGIRNRAATALRMTEMCALRHEQVLKLFDQVDHIVAVCDWVRAAILANGVPAQKVSLCRQGVELRDNDRLVPRATNSDAREVGGRQGLRLCFLGRVDPTKGGDVLIRALGLLPGLPLELDIYGVAQPSSYKDCAWTWRQLARGDGRIRFMEPVGRDELLATIGKYDLLLVPSQLLETGPLVVLEAFAAGTPVIGSRLGGIAELIDHGVNGLLVEASDPRVWSAAIRYLATDDAALKKMRARLPAPRTMATVADEMMKLYAVALGR